MVYVTADKYDDTGNFQASPGDILSTPANTRDSMRFPGFLGLDIEEALAREL